MRLLALGVVAVRRGGIGKNLSTRAALRGLFLQEAVYRVLLFWGLVVRCEEDVAGEE